MKRNLISLLLLLIVTCSWAQDKDTSASDEKQRIPIKPIIVEGELTGVPDGNPIKLAFRRKKSLFYSYGYNTLVDTIRNGKFHIEKKFLFLDDGDSKDNVEYMLCINGCGLDFYACQGAKVKVTGTPDLPNLRWRADCNYPLQKESNEYSDFKRMIIKELDKKAPRDVESDSEEKLEKVQSIRDSIYIVSKLDFMKNRECNPVFIQELWDISFRAHRIGSENLSDRIRNLIKEKVPKDYDDDQNLIKSKRFLVPSSKFLHVGDKMIDFTLYDRDDKEHKLSEFVGKKIVLLQFSTLNCGPCQAIKPTIEEFYAKHKNEVEIITISMDNEEIWKKEKKVSWHDWNDHAFGTIVGSKFDIPGWPFYVIIRPDGIIGSIFLGTDKLQKYFNSF